MSGKKAKELRRINGIGKIDDIRHCRKCGKVTVFFKQDFSFLNDKRGGAHGSR